ncbi:MAG: hypothetical protein HZR80_07295 [Candidatus Heimdallarchaeota archaeon]
MLEIKKTEEWAFFFFFIGGALLIANAIVGLIIGLIQTENLNFLDGIGFFVYAGYSTWSTVVGAVVNILIGALALIAGLKIFINAIFNIMIKIDVAIVGLVLFILGIASFTLPGFLLVVGGIYCFVYRLTVDGANNPKAK